MDFSRKQKIYHLISNTKVKIKELQEELQELENFLIDEVVED